jgi:hypothetical protein
MTKIPHPYPSLLAAYQWTRLDAKLRSDWQCCICLECQRQGVMRIHPLWLDKLSWHWLAEHGYHQLHVL